MKWKGNESIRNLVFAILWMLLIFVVGFLIGQIIVAVIGSESKGISDILTGKTEEVDSVWDGRALSIDDDGDDIRPLTFDLNDTIQFHLGSYNYYPVYVSCSNPIDSVILFVNSDSVLAFQFHDIDSLKVYSDFSDANHFSTIMDGFESENKAFVVIIHEEVIINE